MESPTPVPHTWLFYAITAVATALGSVATVILSRFIDRRKNGAEVQNIEASTRHLEVTAELLPIDMTMKALAEVQRVIHKAEEKHEEWIRRESQLIMQKNHWQRKCEDYERKWIDAEADAQAAQLFVDQLHAAAKLVICEHHPHGVRLSDFTPRQLNPEKADADG